MAKFKYQAKNMEGETIVSSLDADNERDVINQLRKQNLVVLSLEEIQQKSKKKSSSFFSKRIKSDEMVIFSRQLATMVGAGLPVLQGLTTLRDQVGNPTLAKVIGNVSASIEGGASFSEAIAQHPKIFSVLFVNMARAGEASGQLSEILGRVAGYLEESAALKRRVKSALMYPMIVSIMAFAITLVLLLKVIPVFKGIYADFGGELPLMTTVLIKISEILNEYLWYLAAGFVGFIFGIRYLAKTPKGRVFVDKLKFKIPVLGELTLKVCISRFSKTFSTLVKSGVPILSAMEIVATTSGNKVIEIAVNKAAEKIKQGESIADPLMESGVFPPMVVKMIAVGEKTGQLDTMLEKIAEFYDEQVKATVAGLTSLIEPLLIAFLGIVVGGIVISMFLPIFKLTTIISG